MAAAIGITPKQHSSGGKDRLLGISKRGDVYLRTLMIHGGRAVVTRARHRDDRLSRWVTGIANRRHPNVAAIALANKTARMAWAMKPITILTLRFAETGNRRRSSTTIA
jgi:transposase